MYDLYQVSQNLKGVRGQKKKEPWVLNLVVEMSSLVEMGEAV